MHKRPFAPISEACILLAITAALPRPAWGRAKTDVLVMSNGDRITCEVKSLSGGVLQADLDYVDGTISVDWLKVARLESKALFLIYMQDGSIHAGKIISPAELPGVPARLEIQPPDASPLVVERSDVVRLTQFSESFFRRFAGGITIGAMYSKGNAATQYTFGSELDYQQTRWGAVLDYNSNLSSNSGAATSTRNQLDFRAYRMLPWNHYFYGGTASLLQSSVQEINRQTILGFGVGRYLKDTNRTRLSILLGLGWQRTSYLSSTVDQRLQNIAVAVTGVNFNAFRFKKSRLALNAYIFPALTEQGRYFSRINTSYYLKLFGKIDWNLSFYGNWDTRPPAHLPGSDYGSSTGLSWTFGNK